MPYVPEAEAQATKPEAIEPSPSAAPPAIDPGVAEYERLADASERNEYDDLLDQERTSQKSLLQSSLYVGTQKDPDQTAKVIALSRKTNLPEPVVERNFDTIARKHKVQAADYDTLIDSTPGLAKWLEDPKNAALAHDDMDNLRSTEGLAKEHKATSEFLSNLFGGLIQAGSGVAKTATSAFDVVLRKKTFGLIDKSMVPGVDKPGEYLDEAAKQYLTPQPSIMKELGEGNILSAGRSAAMQFAANAPNQAAIIALSIAGGPAAGLTYAGSTTAGTKYEESLKKGVDPSIAAGNALITGGIEAGFERLGTLGILKSWENAIAKEYGKKVSRQFFKEFGKTLAYSVAAEGNEEALTSIAQDFADYVTGVNPKALEGMGERAFNAGVVGAVSGGALTSPSGIAAGVQSQRVAKQADADRRFFTSLKEKIKESKLFQRMPEAHKEFLDSATEGVNMYVPLEAMKTYFQGKGKSIEDVVDELDIRESYDEAKRSSGEVQIPLSKFVEKYGNTEHFEGLENDVKFQAGPDSFTPNELKAIRGEQSQAAGEVEQATQVDDAKKARDEAAAKVFVEAKQKLEAIGIKPEQVEANAKLIEEFFATQAEDITRETGNETSAYDLFQTMNLDFRRFKNKTERDLFVLDEQRRMADEARAAYGQEVLGQSKQELIGLARRALENIPDVSRDAVADALGLDRLEVRRLKGIPKRSGKKATGTYSSDEIRRAAGILSIGTERYFDQSAPYTKPEGIALEYTPAEGLEPFQRRVEENLARYLSTPEAEQAYAALPDTFGGKILDTDFARELSPEYRADRTGAMLHTQSTHSPAGQFVWDLYRKKLDTPPTGTVVIMHGGGGSGKTTTREGAARFVTDESEIVYDGTGQRLNDQIDKIEAALASGRPVRVAMVYTEIGEAARRALARFRVFGRTIPPKAFVQGHIQGLENFFALAEKYKGNKSVKFLAYDNSGHAAQFIPLENLNKLRYIKNGETVEQATERLLPKALEYLSEAEAEVKTSQDRARADEEIRSRARGVFEGSNRQSDGSGPGRSGSFEQSKAQGRLAPPLYSRLIRTVEEKMGGSATVEQINGMLKEIKPEERKWLGLDEFLQQKEKEAVKKALGSHPEFSAEGLKAGIDAKAKISKEDLLAFLRANALEIKEVQYGGSAAIKEGDTVFGVYAKSGEHLASFMDREEARKFIEFDADTRDDIDDYSIQEEEYTGQTLEDSPNEGETGLINLQRQLGKINTEWEELREEVGDARREIIAGLVGDAQESKFEKFRQDVTDKLELDKPIEEYQGLIDGLRKIAPSVKEESLKDYIKLRQKAFALERERTDLRKQIDKIERSRATKFQNYTLPGGENYREVLFTLPANGDESRYKELVAKRSQAFSKAARERPNQGIGAAAKELGLWTEQDEAEFRSVEGAGRDPRDFRSSHFDEPNVIAHTRLNDRVDADGKRVLFVEEIQSDWHQAGRKRGYKGDGKPEVVGYSVFFDWAEDGKKGRLAQYYKTKEEAQDALERGQKTRGADAKNWRIVDILAKPDESSMVPDAPFRKTWHEFVLKRIIRMAAEQGYDRVAWTTGEQQAERYDLSKQVDEIQAYYVEGKDTYTIKVRKDGETVTTLGDLKEAQLEDQVGKDLAAKIVADRPGKAKSYKGLDLKVGGEGMKGFYDKILVDFANKFGKKYGAKVGVMDILSGGPDIMNGEAVRGAVAVEDGSVWRVEFEDTGERVTEKAFETEEDANEWISKAPDEIFQEKTKVHSLEITPSLKKAALEEGFSMFQGDKEDPRGQITFGGRTFNIDIFDESDPSTVPHEINHFLFEVMGELAEKEGAGSKSIQDKYKKILDWLGAKSRSEITTEQHEKLSDALLHFYKSGEAPSLSLREAFHLFRRWFTRLWKKVQIQRVDLPEDVKAAMARWFATDEQIAEAKVTMGLTEELKSVPGLSSATKEQLAKLEEQARSDAEDKILKPQLDALTKQHQERLDEERKRFRAAAAEQVSYEPVFRAIDGLRSSGKKVDPYKLAEQFLAKELTGKQAAEFELLADEHGFKTSDELAKAIIEAGKTDLFNQKVEALVKEGLEQVGMLKGPGQIREEAIRAIHSEQQSELLSLEREALLELAAGRVVTEEARRRNRAVAREEARAMEDEAKRLLAQKPASEAARPQVYITQERNAAARVARFMATKNYAKAAEAKRQQLMAHALVREAFRINEEVDKHFKYLQQFVNRGGDLQGMPYGFNRQIDAILARYGLQDAKTEDVKTMKAIAERMANDDENPNDIANATGFSAGKSGFWVQESLADFVIRQNENYHAILIPDSVMSGQAFDIDTMSLTELRDLRDAVEMIVTSGRKHNRFFSEFIRVEIKQAALEIRRSIEEKIGTPRAEDFGIGDADKEGLRGTLKKILDLPDSVIPSMVNIETLANFLDHGDQNGPVRRFMYRLMSHSEGKKQVMLEQAIKDVNAILERYYTPKELAAYKTEKRVSILGFKNALTMENVLSMALNWGNKTNRDRIVEGYNVPLSDVHDALSFLEKKDWDFVQEVWDYLDTYWPEIKRLEMKVKGVEPVKVEPLQVVTKFGVYRGGYYPIAYDYNKNADAAKMNEQRSELFKQYSAASAHTERGHAEARVVRVKRPVRLSLGVMFDHLENVIHDVSYREAVIDLNRLLREKDVKTAIQNAIGLKGFRAIDQWLTDIASDQRQSMQDGEQFLRWFRMKATMSTLGFRAFTLPMDITGNTLTLIHEIGPARTMRAIADHLFGSGETNAFVVEKSVYMRQRANTMDRDLADVQRRWKGSNPVISHFAFFFQRFADDALAKPLWKEVYRHALGTYTEEVAIQMADEAVKRTLGSGSPVDLVGAQRGAEFKKIMTMYYSWASMMFNRAWLEGKIAGLEYRKENLAKALMIAARGTFFLWVAQAINENFWRELLRNEKDDDEEKKKKRILGRTLQQPFGYVWLGRDIMGGVIDYSTGQRGNIRLSPIEQAAETIFKPIGKGVYFAFTDPGKFDQKYFEESAKAASVILGAPQSLNAMTFNFIDWTNGEGELAWRDALSRRQKK